MGSDDSCDDGIEGYKFENLESAVDAFADGGPHNPDLRLNTVRDYWEGVMDLGAEHFEQTEAHHEANEQLQEEEEDEHDNEDDDEDEDVEGEDGESLGERFLNTPIDEIGTPEFKEKFKDQIDIVLDAVNEIYPLAGIKVPD